MAVSSLFTLIDDIATVLDDIAILTKVTAKKTAGLVGDDLAVNAAQISGVASNRELPVIWAVTKGSFINKLILVPIALLISTLVPILIFPLLAVGGIYLCFEGIDKIWHSLVDKKQPKPTEIEILTSNLDLKKLEQNKIKAAIRTDFVLSAEIIVIALGAVEHVPIGLQIGALSLIAILMTIGVYGLVAVIIKIDDLGIWLMQQTSSLIQSMGRGLVKFAPWLMRALSYVGTMAMFLVGGGIIVHGLPAGLRSYLHSLVDFNWLPFFAAHGIINLLSGMIVGILTVLVINGLAKVLFRLRSV